jgi:hypothetical protein
VLYRAAEHYREASRYMGARLPRAQVVEVPGVDHLPWEGDQRAVLDEIGRFLGDVDKHPEPEVILTTVLEAEATREFAAATISRFRGIPMGGAPEGRLRARFDGPARAVRCASALAEYLPHVRAGVHTGECELSEGRLTGPALEIASGVTSVAQPGEILATSTVQDLVAGSGIEFAERGTFAIPLAGSSREWRLFAALK